MVYFFYTFFIGFLCLFYFKFFFLVFSYFSVLGSLFHILFYIIVIKLPWFKLYVILCASVVSAYAFILTFFSFSEGESNAIVSYKPAESHNLGFFSTYYLTVSLKVEFQNFYHSFIAAEHDVVCQYRSVEEMQRYIKKNFEKTTKETTNNFRRKQRLLQEGA